MFLETTNNIGIKIEWVWHTHTQFPRTPQDHFPPRLLKLWQWDSSSLRGLYVGSPTFLKFPEDCTTLHTLGMFALSLFRVSTTHDPKKKKELCLHLMMSQKDVVWFDKNVCSVSKSWKWRSHPKPSGRLALELALAYAGNTGNNLQMLGTALRVLQKLSGLPTENSPWNAPVLPAVPASSFSFSLSFSTFFSFTLTFTFSFAFGFSFRLRFGFAVLNELKNSLWANEKARFWKLRCFSRPCSALNQRFRLVDKNHMSTQRRDAFQSQ